MPEKIMKLQDERNDIIRRYKRRELRSAEAIKLLRENDDKMAEAKKRRKSRA